MDKIFYRIDDLSKILSIAKSTIFKLMSQNKFPKSIKITSGIAVWDRKSIETWCEEQSKGT